MATEYISQIEHNKLHTVDGSEILAVAPVEVGS